MRFLSFADIDHGGFDLHGHVQRGRRSEGLVTGPPFVTFVFVYKLAIFAEAVGCFVTPEKAIVTAGNRRIPNRIDKHALPAEMDAPVVIRPRESCGFHTLRFASRRQQRSFNRHFRELNLVSVLA